MVAEYAHTAAVASMPPDDQTWPAAPEAEAFRLGVYALVRLGTYEPLAAAVLEAGGGPVTSWWPVAYALGRIGDARAQVPLLRILKGPGTYAVAFAARGLGGIKDPASVLPLAELLSAPQRPPDVIVSAVRALAQTGDLRATSPLVKLASDPGTDQNIKLEVVGALGALHAADGLPIVQDLLTDSWPTMRAAALRAAAAIDPESFVRVLSSLDPDSQWSVRAALAEVLATLPAEAVASSHRSSRRWSA
jgi:HEAT repeat protein